MINREERYKAANEAQKHYDNMSSLIIGSIIATPAAVLIAYKDLRGTNHSEYLLFGAAIVILILCWMYFSASSFARKARATCSAIEREKLGEEIPGISSVYCGYCKLDEYKEKGESFANLSFRYKVLLLALILAFGMSAFGFSEMKKMNLVEQKNPADAVKPPR